MRSLVCIALILCLTGFLTDSAVTPHNAQAATDLWPASNPGPVAEPAFLRDTPVQLYLITTNFPLINDILRLPSAFTEALQRLDDESLMKQLAVWDEELPPRITFRLYEDAQHIHTWYRRLLVLETLAQRPTQRGSFAREQLKAFYRQHAGEPLTQMDMEPRRTLVAAMAQGSTMQSNAQQFYAEIPSLPSAFVTAFSRLIKSEFAIASSRDARIALLRDLAGVLLKARRGPELAQTAEVLAAATGLSRDRLLLAQGWCIADDPRCVPAVRLIAKEKADIPEQFARFAEARSLTPVTDSGVRLTADQCSALGTAALRMQDAGFSWQARETLRRGEDSLCGASSFIGALALVMVRLEGRTPATQKLIEKGLAAPAPHRALLAAAAWDAYLRSLPELFRNSHGPEPLAKGWFFESPQGVRMERVLKAYAIHDAAQADLIRLVLKVLSLRSEDDLVRDRQHVDELAAEAKDLARRHPTQPLFARLHTLLWAQNPTSLLGARLETGEGIPTSDVTALQAVLPHVMKKMLSARPGTDGLPRWFGAALAALPDADEKVRQIKDALTLTKAVKDRSLVASLSRRYLDRMKSSVIEEKNLIQISSDFFNLRALLAIHRMPDAPPGASSSPWPSATYWTNPKVFPLNQLFSGRALARSAKLVKGEARKDRMQDALDAFKDGLAHSSGKAEKLALSWWNTDALLAMDDRQQAIVSAAAVATTYATFHDSIVLPAMTTAAESWMFTLFATAFDFVMKPSAAKEGSLAVDLDYRCTPRLFVLPPLPLQQFETLLEPVLAPKDSSTTDNPVPPADGATPPASPAPTKSDKETP